MAEKLPRIAIIYLIALAFLIGLFVFGAQVLVIVRLMDRDAIHDAAREGDAVRVEQILDQHPERLESRDRLEMTPLQEAALKGEVEVMKVLIRRGANVDALWDLARTGDGGWNALHITAIQGHAEAARALIQAGAEINRKTLQGETPLDIALRHNHRDLADLLRAAGGRPGKEL